MRSIFTFTMAVLIITACSQTSITATPTPHLSTTPTRISTVTPTFLPTFTSTPQAPELNPEQQAWEAHFAGTAHVSADGTIVDSVSGERIGSETDVWTYNEDGTYTRKYFPSNLGGEELSVTYRPEDITIVLDANGKPTGAWDMSGWVKNEKGELVRETKEFPKKDPKKLAAIPGVFVTMEVFSREEKRAELLQTSDTASTGERLATDDRGIKFRDGIMGARLTEDITYYTFNGVWEPAYTAYLWGDNVLTVDGLPKGTAFYMIKAIGAKGEMAIIAWRANGVDHVSVIDKAGLSDLANWDAWFKTHKPKV